MAKSISDLLFGDGTLAEVVWWIRRDAYEKGTVEAFTAAYEQMHGIDRFWIVYQSRLNAGRKGSDRLGTFESIALSNEMRELQRAADDPDYRKMVVEAWQEAKAAAQSREVK